MPLQLISDQPTAAELFEYIIYIDPKTGKEWADKDQNGDPIGEGYEEAKFWLADLPANKVNRIRDELYSFKTDGTSILKIGLSVEKKIQAAVKKWDGVTDFKGNPAPITPKALGQLPSWVQNRLIDKINELNSLSPELESD